MSLLKWLTQPFRGSTDQPTQPPASLNLREVTCFLVSKGVPDRIDGHLAPAATEQAEAAAERIRERANGRPVVVLSEYETPSDYDPASHETELFMASALGASEVPPSWHHGQLWRLVDPSVPYVDGMVLDVLGMLQMHVRKEARGRGSVPCIVMMLEGSSLCELVCAYDGTSPAAGLPHGSMLQVEVAYDATTREYTQRYLV